MTGESFEDFRRQIQGPHAGRKHKVTNSYGTYDYYKFYRKNKPKEKKYVLTESQYFAIIRTVNELLGEELVANGTLNLLAKMGTLEIRKYKISPRIDEEGNLVFEAPIDWDRTLKLWHEDRQAYLDKVLIKVENREVFKTIYNRTRAVYENKSFYLFTLNEGIQKKIRNKIREGRMDAFELKRRKRYE